MGNSSSVLQHGKNTLNTSLQFLTNYVSNADIDGQILISDTTTAKETIQHLTTDVSAVPLLASTDTPDLISYLSVAPPPFDLTISNGDTNPALTAQRILSDPYWKTTIETATQTLGSPGSDANLTDAIDKIKEANTYGAVVLSTLLNASGQTPVFLYSYAQACHDNFAIADKRHALDVQQAAIDAQYSDLMANIRGRGDTVNAMLAASNDNVDKLNQFEKDGKKTATYQELATQYNQYLDGRLGNTKNRAIKSYEEFYQTILLQNEHLRRTEEEITNNRISNEKQFNHYDGRLNTLYTAYMVLLVVYYMLFFIYTIILLFFRKEVARWKKALALIGLGLFPWVALPIERFLYQCFLFGVAILTGSRKPTDKGNQGSP